MILNNFQNLDIKKKISALLALTFSASAAIAYFVILPAINDIKMLRSELITQKIELEDKMSKDKNLADLNDRIKKIEPQLQILDKIFINKNRELDFITIMESIEKKNLVTQKLAINPIDSNDKNLIKTVPITIVVNGEFKNILQYLCDLEALPYYVNINNIELSGAENVSAKTMLSETNSNNIRLSISADTFWK